MASGKDKTTAKGSKKKRSLARTRTTEMLVQTRTMSYQQWRNPHFLQLALVNSNDLRRSIKTACQWILYFKGTLTGTWWSIQHTFGHSWNFTSCVLFLTLGTLPTFLETWTELEGPTSNTRILSNTVEISPEDFNLVYRQRDHPRLETVSLHPPRLWFIPWGTVNVWENRYIPSHGHV